MSIVVGIDIGGSTTKIAGFDGEKKLIPVQISANNAIASLFGAFGKFLYDNKPRGKQYSCLVKFSS